MLTVPDDVYFGHPITGGMSVPHLWDETNLEKCLILQTSLMDETLDIYNVMQGGILRLRQKYCSTYIPLTTPWNGLVELDEASWMTSLWEWMTEHDLTISVPLFPPARLFEDDICVMDHFIAHHLSELGDTDATLLKIMAKENNTDLSDTLKTLVQQIHLLQKLLLENNIFWISDMTVASATHRGNTNRTLARVYNHAYTQRKNNLWVKQLLGGIPGLLTLSLKCDFTLAPPRAALSRHKTWSQYQLFHHHSSAVFAGLDGSELDHKELIESHTDFHETVETSTDGSVKDGEGTYGYLLFAMTPNSSTALAYGGGKESYPSIVEQ